MSAFISGPLVAQTGPVKDQADQIFAGSEIEQYLRYLQTTGAIPARPWSVRPFPAGAYGKIRPDSIHPWSTRRFFEEPDPGDGVALLPVRSRVSFNSSFPYGWNDGAVWTGKGLTSSVSFGAMARLGPVTLIASPTWFRAENDPFPLVPNGLGPEDRFVDPWQPNRIDRPQRFGDDSYMRFDPGQSSLRLDLRGIGVGVSTANEFWGPASEHPIILGNNAPGFVHAFAETSRPANVWIGSVDARVIWGRLDDSEYWTLQQDPDEWRFMSGLILTFAPRGLTGLEVGVSRVFHSLLTTSRPSVDDVLEPFGTFLKKAIPLPGRSDATNSENQLASAFIRWAFAPAGLEIYGEYGREDHSWDLRDFLLEIDQQRAYSLGLRKVWRQDDTHLFGFRAEVLNGQVATIKQVRPQSPFYGHTVIRQGHTNRGQPLGSGALFSGGGSIVAVDRYSPTGRLTVKWARNLNDPGTSDLPLEADVQHAIGIEGLYLRDRLEIEAGINGVYEFNRNFGDDEFNLNTFLGVRVPL